MNQTKKQHLAIYATRVFPLSFEFPNVIRLLILCVLVQFALNLTAQDDVTPPYTAPPDQAGHSQLGTVLEGDFMSMLRDCMPGQTKDHLSVQKEKKILFWSTTDDAQTTAIPDKIQAALPVKTAYIKGPIGQSLGSLFLYVYSDPEKTSDADVPSDLSKRLPLPIDNNPVSLQAATFSGVSYGETCTTSISGKVSVSGGYSVPIADVKAALASDASSSTSWSMDLVEGMFVSPVPDLFKSYDASTALYPRLLLWKWYFDQNNSGNSAVLSTTNWLMQSLHGISVYQLYGDKKSFTFQTQGSVSINAAFLKSDDSVDASLSTGSQTKIKIFQILSYLQAQDTSKSDRTWAKLLTPSQLASDQFGTTLRENAQAFVIAPNGTHVEHQVAQGVPRAVCNPSLWGVQGLDGQPVQGLSLTGVAPDQTTSPSSTSDMVSCVFETTYAVPGTVPTQGIPLKYRLVFPIDSSNKYLLTAASGTLVTADGPTLTTGLYLQTFKPPVDMGGGSSRLDWDVTLQVGETATTQIKAGTQPTLSGTQLQCGTQAAMDVVPTNVNLQTTGTTKQLQFTVSKVVSPTDNLNLTAAPSSLITCHLNGIATFTVTAGPPVPKPLSSGQGINLLYPPANQPQPAPPQAAPPKAGSM